MGHRRSNYFLRTTGLPLSAQNQQLLPLTSMRFFLAMWVIAYHLSWPGGAQIGWWSNLPHSLFSLLHGGLAILDVFFLTSGFILAYHYRLNSFWSQRELRKYAIARFSRLFPVYLLSLIVIAPLEVHASMFHASMAAAKEWIKMGLVCTLLQSWIPRTALLWNKPAWSLSVNLFFYLLFPFGGVFLWRAWRIRTLLLLAALLWFLALSVPLLVINMHIHGLSDADSNSYIEETHALPSEPRATAPLNLTMAPIAIPQVWANFVRYNPLVRLPEFLLGIVLAHLYRRLIEGKHFLVGRGQLLYVPALVLLVSLLTWGGTHIPYLLLPGGLMLPLWSCVVLGFALGGGPLARFLSEPPFVFLGQASYCVYVLHFVVIQWIVRRIGVSVLNDGTVSLSVAFGAILISSVAYIFFEQPAHRILQAWLSERLIGRQEADTTKGSGILTQAAGLNAGNR
jgi:peptidoglycan/LPS O-acetylase OafA/YrhL